MRSLVDIIYFAVNPIKIGLLYRMLIEMTVVLQVLRLKNKL